MSNYNQWNNVPDLQWSNEPDLQWVDEIILILFFAAATFIAESRGFYFQALEKANFFIAGDKTRYIQSKIKP